MSQIDLMGISEVRETEYIDEVNANLQNGWKLLFVYAYAPYNDAPNDLRSVYSLGWPSGQGEPKFIELEHGGWAPTNGTY